VKKETKIDPDFAPADVVIGIAACILFKENPTDVIRWA
jgi:hypothetical protein